MFLSSNAISQKKWTVEIDGMVTNDGQVLAGSTITLLKNSAQADKVVTSVDGEFQLTLSPDNDYMIVVSKDGYVSKRISFSTKNVPEKKVGVGFPAFPIEISLFEEIEGLNTSILKRPIGKISYYKNGNNFDYDEEYTASIQTRVQKLKEELKAKRREAKKAPVKTVIQDTTTKKKPAESTVKNVSKTKSKPTATAVTGGQRTPPGKKGPVTAGDYLRRGDAKGKSGDYEGALQDYNKSIELDPKLGGAYLSRGAINFILQKLESAVADCDKSIELNEALVEFHLKRSRVKTILEDHKGASMENNKASKVRPDLAKAHFVRGNVKYFLGEKESGCTDLIKASGLGYLKAYTYIKQYCD